MSSTQPYPEHSSVVPLREIIAQVLSLSQQLTKKVDNSSASFRIHFIALTLLGPQQRIC